LDFLKVNAHDREQNLSYWIWQTERGGAVAHQPFTEQMEKGYSSVALQFLANVSEVDVT